MHPNPHAGRDWDLKVMLAGETRWRGITQPKYLSRWVDLRWVGVGVGRDWLLLHGCVFVAAC